MFVLHLPRPRPLELWSHKADEPTASFFVFVLVIACCGGALHGIAMGIRKKYGEGHEKYWLEWKWWVGFWADGLAGVMIWPAMPFVSVQIFVPLIIVVQLGSSYIFGLVAFGEKSLFRRNIGLGSAVAGIIGISLSTSHEAAHFTISQFWSHLASARFVMTTFCILVFLAGSFFGFHRSTFWALAAAACEGIQYVCSRSIVDSLFDHQISFLMQPAVLAAFTIKGCCIVSILHFQQLGLEADLSRFAGIYLVGCVLFMCVYGWAFFGDAMPATWMFFLSCFFTLAGIWLLNQKEELPGKDEMNGKAEVCAEGDAQNA